jgi:hypothetical protein
MRRQKEVTQDVLARAGRYHVVHEKGQSKKDPAPLRVKQVWVDQRRYVVCRNEDQAHKDAADRDAIIQALQEKLKHGDKGLVGNKGYRKYLRTQGRRFTLDESKIKAEARMDGKWVLRTNTALETAEVALKYKQLWMVEAIFPPSEGCRPRSVSVIAPRVRQRTGRCHSRGLASHSKEA